MRPSNRPAAEASAPHAAQKKVNEQTQRLQEVFDSCDTEHLSELDVCQIGKCLQREHHLTLSEEVIKHHRDRALFTIGTFPGHTALSCVKHPSRQ